MWSITVPWKKEVTTFSVSSIWFWAYLSLDFPYLKWCFFTEPYPREILLQSPGCTGIDKQVCLNQFHFHQQGLHFFHSTNMNHQITQCAWIPLQTPHALNIGRLPSISKNNSTASPKVSLSKTGFNSWVVSTDVLPMRCGPDVNFNHT